MPGGDDIRCIVLAGGQCADSRKARAHAHRVPAPRVRARAPGRARLRPTRVPHLPRYVALATAASLGRLTCCLAIPKRI